jgi:hypothetical protein
MKLSSPSFKVSLIQIRSPISTMNIIPKARIVSYRSLTLLSLTAGVYLAVESFI